MESGFRFNSDDSSSLVASSMVGNSSTLNNHSLQPGEKCLRKTIRYNGQQSHQPSGKENNLIQGLQLMTPVEPEPFMHQGTRQNCPEMISALNKDAFSPSHHQYGGELSVNKITNLKSPRYLLSHQRLQSNRNVINGSHAPTRQWSSSVSVKIDGLYSPTKLIPKEFRTNKDLHRLKQQSDDDFDGVKIHQELPSKDVNIIVVETDDVGTVRILKTLTGNSQIETRVPFWLAFKKNITMSGFAVTMKVWYMQELIENSEHLRACLLFDRSVIVLVYDVTGKDCVCTLQRLIPFVVGIIRFKIPIILVGNTSDITNPSTLNGSDKKRERFISIDYALYLRNKYGLSSYRECSIESVAEVKSLFRNIVKIAI